MAHSRKEFQRLPTTVCPLKYKLFFNVVDLDRERFEGFEKIILQVKEKTRQITCHATELWVSKVSLHVEKRDLECTSMTTCVHDQTITFYFDEDIPVCQEATLSLTFFGILNNQLRGFYRSEYFVDGEKRKMAVTQFEACDARRAFVCWDEPAVKATFEISVTADDHLSVVSNTEVTSTQVLNNSKKTWNFAETPIMSTYLAAIVVGEFDSVSSYTKEGVRVNVYTPLGKSHRGKFALNVATKALSFYTQSFGIDYPLRKLDMLAIPDFAAGAMENWGCVTYRETRLLIDDKKSSIAMKTACARTVCHELAHMWYGNYVTMEWWTSLWLNEGFARYMEFEAVNHIFPEWRVWEKFVQEILVGVAMAKDSMVSSHPIEVEVGHPEEVDQIFDVISYAKGASIIRMVSYVLGRDAFYQGIHDYLNEFQYANAKTQDLWNALEKASNEKISQFMGHWTLQTGFPVLEITEDENRLKLSQKRFLNNPSSTNEARWDIPLFISSSTSSSRLVDIWRHEKDEVYYLDSPCLQDSWFVLNPQQTGFYIVNYTKTQWSKLATAISNKQLNTIDRMSLLSNMFRLALAGEVKLSDALSFTQAYEDEKEFTVWSELSDNLNYYCRLFETQSFLPQFQSYIVRIALKMAEWLTWDVKSTDGETSSLLRRSVFSLLIAAKHEESIKTALERFEEYILDPENSLLSPDLRCLVFRVAAQYSGENALSQLKKLYQQSDFIEEKNDCLSSFGYVATKKLKLDALTWAIQNVRSQDIHLSIYSVASTEMGSNIAWTFTQDHWNELNKKYTQTVIGRIVCGSLNSFKTEEAAQNIEHFFTSHPHQCYQRSLEATLEMIRTRSRCLERNGQDVQFWLNQQVK